MVDSAITEILILRQNMQRMVLHDWAKPVRVAESVLAADPVI
jgi:hypothetical protein